MESKQKKTFFLCAGMMLLMIADSKNAIAAAADAVSLCIRTAIPSLFPFFVLSGIMVPELSCISIPWLAKILKIPVGWEGIFLLGTLGGYPVGAQAVCQGYQSGKLSKNQSERMIGICTNCGPSFLFGVVGAAFSHWTVPWVLMITIFSSAIATGCLWPGPKSEKMDKLQLSPVSLTRAVRQAIQSVSLVCAWIVMGKILLFYLHRSLLSKLPENFSVLLTGMLELTNGCLSLQQIPDESVRMIAASIMVTFGGICVFMQVHSLCASAGLSSKQYLSQKLVQCIISCLLCVLYLSEHRINIAIFIAFLLILFKTTVAFRGKIVYNASRKGGFHHAVPKKN